jgi:hypothetical protein
VAKTLSVAASEVIAIILPLPLVGIRNPVTAAPDAFSPPGVHPAFFAAM